MTTSDERSAERYQERERLINNDEASTGFHTNEKYHERMKAHIEKMRLLKGDHLNDIETYTELMNKGGSRRRASKHSKKSKKSKKHSKKSRKSRKTKSRRH